jgi:orotidine-5'-phosphate decarboxylase
MKDLIFKQFSCRRKELYKQVLETSKSWKNSENLMYVVGATKAEYFTEVRKLSLIVLLVPESTRRKPSEVCKYTEWMITSACWLILQEDIYASNGTDFAAKARQEAVKMQQEMEGIISLK